MGGISRREQWRCPTHLDRAPIIHSLSSQTHTTRVCTRAARRQTRTGGPRRRRRFWHLCGHRASSAAAHGPEGALGTASSGDAQPTSIGPNQPARPTQTTRRAARYRPSSRSTQRTSRRRARMSPWQYGDAGRTMGRQTCITRASDREGPLASEILRGDRQERPAKTVAGASGKDRASERGARKVGGVEATPPCQRAEQSYVQSY